MKDVIKTGMRESTYPYLSHNPFGMKLIATRSIIVVQAEVFCSIVVILLTVGIFREVSFVILLSADTLFMPLRVGWLCYRSLIRRRVRQPLLPGPQSVPLRVSHP